MADTIKTNLGPVTAYADAKAHGYTGTREEFGQLLANAGLNLKAAETAKADAEAAKQAAETAQQAAAENQKNAGTQAANAKASADTAAEQAAVAEESAADAANSATAAQESENNAGLSATAAANAEAAAKQAQNAAETAKADAETAKTAAGNSADAAANSAADAKKTLESIPADYSKLSGKVNDNTSGISELKEDLVKASNGIVNDIDLSFIDTLTSEGSYFMDVAIPKGFNIIFENKSSMDVSVNLCYGNEEKNYGGVDPNKSIEIEAPFFVDKIRSYCNGTDVNIHIKAINPQNTSIINIEKNIEDTNELLKNINEGIDVAVTDTIGSIGSYNYYIKIPKGYKCIFYNTSQYSCTLNISDGENEINLTNSILPNTEYYFESPFYIKKIRCYWGGTDVSFKIKALNSVDENMKMINNVLQGFFYINGNGDIEINVDGAFVDVKVNSSGFSYRHPSFYQTLSSEDVLNSIDGSTYSDGVLAFRIPETNYLIYDISENKLKITPIEINDNSIILIKNWYGNISGYWIELYGYRQANRNIEYIKNLESKIYNSPPMYMLTDDEIKAKVKEYSSLFANVSEKTEQFIFITDTHYYNNILNETENPQKYIATISKIYHSTPASYVLDGGDWIDYFNDVNDYCYTMGLIKGVCDSLLSPHYFALGNHDTNYQSGTEANKVVQKAVSDQSSSVL